MFRQLEGGFVLVLGLLTNVHPRPHAQDLQPHARTLNL